MKIEDIATRMTRVCDSNEVIIDEVNYRWKFVYDIGEDRVRILERHTPRHQPVNANPAPWGNPSGDKVDFPDWIMPMLERGAEAFLASCRSTLRQTVGMLSGEEPAP